MESTDHFSSHSEIYSAYRPVYPQPLYDFILRHVEARESAWDCGTGNGQVARVLCRHFKKVFATDISQQQIDQGTRASNIFYSIERAEKTSFEDSQFNLITVAQALHWFQADKFFDEVRRTGSPGGLIAVWGYDLLNISAEIDNLFLKFYHETVGPYWNQSRKLVESRYEGIPFPFEAIAAPGFEIVVEWTPEHFEGYLTSWSATQKFISINGFNPAPAFVRSLGPVWPSGMTKKVTFPLFLKLGRIHA